MAMNDTIHRRITGMVTAAIVLPSSAIAVFLAFCILYPPQTPNSTHLDATYAAVVKQP